MAQVAICTPVSAPGSSATDYFDFTPKAKMVTRTLDAFHVRNDNFFDLPRDAHIYAARPLPPVPGLVLRSPSSTLSLRTVSANSNGRRPSRPSLGSPGRHNTTDCVPQASPVHDRQPSIDSVMSHKTDLDECSRPRTSRAVSFRNLLHRSNFPAPPESSRTTSAMSQRSDCTRRSSRDSRHDSMDTDLSSAPGSRRPSQLSINTGRSRKSSQESVPTVARPSSGRKSTQSIASSHRWNIFKSDKTTDDVENVAPVPITPPSTAELSCQRCYYYSMRNCNGWVMGGTHGDACESCTMHGFFGSP